MKQCQNLRIVFEQQSPAHMLGVCRLNGLDVGRYQVKQTREEASDKRVESSRAEKGFHELNREKALS